MFWEICKFWIRIKNDFQVLSKKIIADNYHLSQLRSSTNLYGWNITYFTKWIITFFLFKVNIQIHNTFHTRMVRMKGTLCIDHIFQTFQKISKNCLIVIRWRIITQGIVIVIWFIIIWLKSFVMDQISQLIRACFFCVWCC